MDRAGLALVAGLAGGLLVGPRLADAVQRWLGWRVVLPLILGWVPPRSALGQPSRTSPRQTSDQAIQIATAVLFAVAGARFGWSAPLVPVLVLISGLVAISAVDLVCWRIPTRFVYLTGAGVLAGIVFAIAADGTTDSLTGMAIGAGLYLLLLGGMHLASPRMLGFGDVRLGTLIGLVVGWMGWEPGRSIDGPLSSVLLAVLLASLAGTLAGVVVLIVRRRARRLAAPLLREAYPFGPWLCLGGLVAILLAG